MFNRFKLFIALCFCAFIYLTFPQDANAVTISVSNFPSTITNQPFNVDIFILGAQDDINYVKIDLYKEGTFNYFGETLVNGVYTTCSGTSCFPVDIINATASATRQARVGTPSTGDYPGPGTYKIRARRYTASGSPASNDNYVSGDVTININFPTSTPTPTPTPTSTPTPTPTSTPTKTPTPKPSPKPSLTESSENVDIQEEQQSEVLGLREGLSEPSPSPLVQGVSEKKFPLAAILLIVGGLIIMGGAGFTLFRKMKGEDYNSNQNEENT